jgi:ATP-dependent Lon protease
MNPKALGRTPILPIRNAVLFPRQRLNLVIGRPRSLAAIRQTQFPIAPEATVRRLLIVTQRNLTPGDPESTDLYSVGTVAQIESIEPLKGSQHEKNQQEPGVHLRVLGLERVRLDEIQLTAPSSAHSAHQLAFLSALPSECLAPQRRDPVRIKALQLAIERLNPLLCSDAEPRAFLIQALELLSIDLGTRQMILEASSEDAQLEKVLNWLNQMPQNNHGKDPLSIDEILKRSSMGSRMPADPEDNPESEKPSTQADGETAPENESEGFAEKTLRFLESQPIPEKTLRMIQDEIRRFKTLPAGSAEHTVLRNWLDWVQKLPWQSRPLPPLSIKKTRLALDQGHASLNDIKQKILEYLAVTQRPGATHQGSILCLVGPPGVGKTTLARSIAEALGRPFARISLGGVRDEAEIRGHRRTYVGAMPGKILQALKRAGALNAVILLDEIDKLKQDIHGDPSSALLEVLDPELHTEFTDHYLNLPIDLSNLFFIATANDINLLQPALRDRLELVPLRGYSTSEKIEIAQAHLIPQESQRSGVQTFPQFSTQALQLLIDSYTREAGVRELQRKIAVLFRARALNECLLEEEKNSAFASALATPQNQDRSWDIPMTLGPPIEPLFEPPSPTDIHHPYHARPGVALALAWTPYGGEILRIECLLTPGDGKLTLTGQLGDVMKESARVAVTLAQAIAWEWTAETVKVDLTQRDLHIHFPGAAIPKEGPSAGLPLVAALLSLFLHRPLPKKVAMSGEISLTGEVLPVGGVEEKLQAAIRAGLKEAYIPVRNAARLQPPPEEARSNIEIISITDVRQLLVLLWKEQNDSLRLKEPLVERRV